MWLLPTVKTMCPQGGGGYSYNSVSEETSKRITSLRFLLIVLVVFIHNNYTFEGIAKYDLHILFIPSAFSIWVQYFISKGIASCAVPVFFLFSSYLQFKKNDKYGVLLKKRVRSLFIPYFLWTIIVLVLIAVTKLAFRKVMPSILENPDKLFTFDTPLEWLWVFIGNYSKEAINTAPFINQFWFVRDLFLLIVFSPLLTKVARKFPTETSIVFSFLYFSGIKPIIVDASALFFYMLGFFLAENDIDFFKVADRCRWTALLIPFAFFTFLGKQIYMDVSSVNVAKVLFASLIALKFSAIICKSEKVFAVSKYFAGYSFFLFAIHMKPLEGWMQLIWTKVLPMTNGFFCLAEYFGVSIIVIVIGTGVGILLKKICPQFFTLLSGGR